VALVLHARPTNRGVAFRIGEAFCELALPQCQNRRAEVKLPPSPERRTDAANRAPFAGFRVGTRARYYFRALVAWLHGDYERTFTSAELCAGAAFRGDKERWQTSLKIGQLVRGKAVCRMKGSPINYSLTPEAKQWLQSAAGKPLTRLLERPRGLVIRGDGSTGRSS
jgi:hypothetical protein